MPSTNRVKGSNDFIEFYSGLKGGSPQRRFVEYALDTLKENPAAGVKIQRPQWPPYYVRNYGITNLWKLNVSREARLAYTLLREGGVSVVVVLEAFLSHKDYEKRFGYV